MKTPTAPFRIVLIYVLAGAAWIAVSDWLLLALTPDYLRLGQAVKGMAFVLLSAALVYALVRSALRKQHELESERERLKSRLAGAQRLEAIGRLTAGIAHDFNNLLTAISGNLEAFMDQTPQEVLPESERVWLSEAASAAHRAEDLTRQLLAFGRQQKLQPEPLDLNHIIHEMERLLHRLIGDRLEIVTETERDLWLMCGDCGPLQQVVMNLALNARDAMPEGGRLTLATANVRVDERAAREDFDFPMVPGDYVRLRVSDTGTGMDRETQAHIYEPFFTTKEKHVGTGLGMSTVFGIVKQSGGYITLDSAPGKGTRFDLYFPRANLAPVAAPSSTDEVEAPGYARTNGARGETILVVEDDPAVRAVVVRTLERHGYTVLQAADGPHALSLIQDPARRRIDLVTTDAVMPDMSGMELVRAARAQRPGLAAILMSGYDADALEWDEPYLAKPFSPAALLARVRDVLDSRDSPG